MHILSASEVEELVEHLTARPDIWLQHAGVWVRKSGKGEEYALAFKIRNGLPQGMYALSTRPIEWSGEAAEDYMTWLLEKYTAYELRMRVKNILQQGGDLEALSRDICELRGEPFTRKHERLLRKQP